MVAKSPPKQKRACPAPLNPNLLRETVKKVDQCMARLQELQYTVSGGAKEVSGTTLSPRSTRGYLRVEELGSCSEVSRREVSRKYRRRNSWQLWENYSQVAADIRNFGQIVRSGKGDNIWGLYGRWHRMKGDLTMCSEALLKQVRSYQGADLWNNKDRFKKFANASLQLCKVYMEISASTGSRRELNAAEMHLRNSIKQG